MLSTQKLTGFADEASRDLDKQIEATKALGWSAISCRMIGSNNIHDMPEAEFQAAADKLDAAGIHVPEFGSAIGNWAKKIDSDFAITVGEISRAIPRMNRLGTKIIRVMSYAQEPWGEDQQEQERFRRMREITKRFTDEGITVAHENCMNWGGFSAEHTLRLIEQVPDMKLIFDTGNPVFQLDRSKQNADGSFPWQDPFEFWQKIREHVTHIHIKDCMNPVSEDVEPEYTMPGIGQAKLKEILTDAYKNNYDGWIAIEPHVATVFHAPDPDSVDWQQCYDSYVEYGRQFVRLIATL
ncbi:sugar phosphate isomerase/epimerase family protein [Luteolibacter algae]|uniref:Sugar phosphate isomerase/epimerase family protein n=1 Tax=Luteolibacter algae TaxID=454151 RepID=A0ABW5D8R7_9BACT